MHQIEEITTLCFMRLQLIYVLFKPILLLKQSFTLDSTLLLSVITTWLRFATLTTLSLKRHELGSRHTTVFACFLRHSHIFYSILKKEKNVRWISDFTDNVPILYSIILTLLGGGLLVFTDVTLIVGGFVSKLHFYLYLSVYLSLKMCQKKKNFRIFKRQTK